MKKSKSTPTSTKRLLIIEEAIQLHKKLEKIGVFTKHEHYGFEPCTCKDDIAKFFGFNKEQRQVFDDLNRLTHLNCLLMEEDKAKKIVSELPHN